MKGPESITAMRDRLVAEKMAARDRANRQRSDDVLAGEHARQEATTARIVKLRELRETRDAVEHEAAETEAKRKAKPEKRANAHKGPVRLPK